MRSFSRRPLIGVVLTASIVVPTMGWTGPPLWFSGGPTNPADARKPNKPLNPPKTLQAVQKKVTSEGLYQAILANSRQAIQEVISRLPKESLRQLLETPFPDGFLPLTLAALAGKVESVQALVEFGATPNRGELHAASSKGHLNVVQYLTQLRGFPYFSRISDPYAAFSEPGDFYGLTALHLAGTRAVLDHFIRGLHMFPHLPVVHNPQTIASKTAGVTPLIFAATHRRPDIVDLLEEWGASLDEQSLIGTALDAAANTELNNPQGLSTLKKLADTGIGDVSMMNLLLQLGADPTLTPKLHDPKQVLHLAYTAFVSELEPLATHLSHQIDPNPDHDLSPLFLAAYSSNSELVKDLIQRGADPNKRVKAATLRGWRYLPDGKIYSFETKYPAQTPLHAAALGKNILNLHILLNHPQIEVNPFSEDGHTPLMDLALNPYFTGEQQVEAARALVRRGADWRLTNSKGKRAIDLAKKAKKTELRAFLNYLDVSWEDPYFRAAMEGDLDAFREYLKSKPNVNVKDRSGKSAFYIAAEMGRENIVRFLLEQGANTQEVFKGKPVFFITTHPIRKLIAETIRPQLDKEHENCVICFTPKEQNQTMATLHVPRTTEENWHTFHLGCLQDVLKSRREQGIASTLCFLCNQHVPGDLIEIPPSAVADPSHHAHPVHGTQGDADPSHLAVPGR